MKNNKKLLLLLISIILTACTSAGLYEPLPKKFEDKATVKGFKEIRAWGDVHSDYMEVSARNSLHQILAAHNGHLPRELNALALSGGGADGAFGAGLLYGWSKTGTRPEFHLVTGISTGALMAPFAFLGSKYDGSLKEVYTTLEDEKIYRLKNPLSVIFEYINPVLKPAIADNSPMKKVLNKYVTQAFLDKIGEEHLKGRRLFIGTTQLNAQRLVIWDMGAIALSKNPKALEVFRKVLLASSALPGIFEPQYFQINVDGHIYKEMHLDGGVETQVMLFEKSLVPFANMAKSEKNLTKRLFIIRNRKISPEWDKVNPRLHHILGRVIGTLTKTQGIGDLYRLYAYSLRDHIDYNLAYIPDSFNEEPKSPFDGIYMKKLFAVGDKLGKKPYNWKKFPPGLRD